MEGRDESFLQGYTGLPSAEFMEKFNLQSLVPYKNFTQNRVHQLVFSSDDYPDMVAWRTDAKRNI